MTKWEYKTLYCSVDFSNLPPSLSMWDIENSSDVNLTTLGLDGWELVSLLPIGNPNRVETRSPAVIFLKKANL